MRLQLEQRLSLHDRAVFRKRVESVDQKAVRPHVSLHEAQSRRRQPIRRGEAVRNRSPLAVVQQFLVHVKEHFRRELFHLITHVVGNLVAAFDRLVTAAFQASMEPLVSIRKRLATTGDDFRDDRVADLKRDQMTGVADSDICRVVRLANLVVLPNVEQLGMKRTLKQMEHEFRDGWSDEADIHWKTCRPASSVQKHRSGNSTRDDCTERIRSIESSANRNLEVVASSAYFRLIPGCILPNRRSGVLKDFGSCTTLLASLDEFIVERPFRNDLQPSAETSLRCDPGRWASAISNAKPFPLIDQRFATGISDPISLSQIAEVVSYYRRCLMCSFGPSPPAPISRQL